MLLFSCCQEHCEGFRCDFIGIFFFWHKVGLILVIGCVLSILCLI